MAYQPWEGIAPNPQVFSQLDNEEITVLAYLTWCSAARRPVYLPDLVALPGEGENPQPLGLDNVLDILDGITEMNICSVRNQTKHAARTGQMPLSVFVGGFKKRTFPGDEQPSQPVTRNTIPVQTAQHPVRRERQRPAKAVEEKPQRYFPKTAPEDRIEVESGVFANARKTPKDIIDAFQEIQRDVARTEADTTLGKVEKVEAMHALAVKRLDIYKQWAKTQPNNRKLAAILIKKKRIVSNLELQVDNARKREAASE